MIEDCVWKRVLEVSGLDNKECRMGNQERVGLKSVEQGLLGSVRQGQNTIQNSASSWSELGLYLMEGPGDKTTEFRVKEWWVRQYWK